MRIFALFVCLLAGSLVIAAAVAVPVWSLVTLVSDQPLHRVLNRLAMLATLVGLFFLTRRLGLADRNTLGYNLPRRAFIRQVAIGWLWGLVLLAPLVMLIFLLDVRGLKPLFADGVPAMKLASLIVAGTLTGLIIACIEETFFRGLLFSVVRRTSSTATAVIAPSALYASLHFLGGGMSLEVREMQWHHGFVVLGRLFERYSHPLAFVDAFLALFALGILLSLVRLRTSSVAIPIGLHAVGVVVISTVGRTTDVDFNSPYAGLVNSYDGVIGWAGFVWFGLIGAILLVTDRQAAISRRRCGDADIPVFRQDP